MKRAIPLLISLCLSSSLLAQYNWTWAELAPMPEAISNNAVVGATSNGSDYVYSFAGIDTSKTRVGISLTSMRYAVALDEWQYISELPDSLGKIAAGASVIGDVIYIIGGYHVFDGPPFERSSDRVHRYTMGTDTYQSDGAAIPTPIDDHVQAVWRDSLIFVVTGWSQTQNVQDVQIYDPALDTWSAGTPVPNGVLYEAFGASGVIIGDTIYYNGGATGNSFNSTGRLRKGVINPLDPAEITWTEEGNNPGDKGYRMAAVVADNLAFWVGGSGVSYNYDGIAYNGSGGVDPLYRILGYDPVAMDWSVQLTQPEGVMDLRGIADFNDGRFILCGGMGPGQQVSNRTFLLTYGGPSGIGERSKPSFSIYPSLLSIDQLLTIRNTQVKALDIIVLDTRGQALKSTRIQSGEQGVSPRELGVKRSGLYYLQEIHTGASIPFVVQ